jgi:hypothetical protein
VDSGNVGAFFGWCLSADLSNDLCRLASVTQPRFLVDRNAKFPLRATKRPKIMSSLVRKTILREPITKKETKGPNI